MTISNALASVAVRDIEAAVQWYAKVFGRPADATPMAGLAEWKFERGGWLQVYALPERAGSCSCTFVISDIELETARLRRLGVDTGVQASGTQVKVLMVKDPDGNSIAFAQAPHAVLTKEAGKRFPNESTEYRKARTALLAEEVELRRHVQRVAAMRRELPPGGQVTKDYRFLDAEGKKHGLADLFGRHDTLFTYFWMFGPERERPCPMCTSLVGSLDIPMRDIEQRIAIAIIGRSPVSRQLAFARERGWTHLDFYETVGDDFASDYRGLDDEGGEQAIIAVWQRTGDKVHLFWAAEGGNETAEPGFDPHLAPDPTPLWTILDWTPGGRGSNWYPKLEY